MATTLRTVYLYIVTISKYQFFESKITLCTMIFVDWHVNSL